MAGRSAQSSQPYYSPAPLKPASALLAPSWQQPPLSLTSSDPRAIRLPVFDIATTGVNRQSSTWTSGWTLR
ncbi:hypothetical protein M3J09_008394 [Ascochyta lentis]